MQAKALAIEALQLVETQGPTRELRIAAELLAKHVLAQESDPLVAVPVATTKLVELKSEHRRYELLLELMNSADPDARELLERSLDAQIAKRDSRIVRLN